MTCVLDASVAVKWFLADEPDGAEALRLVQDGETMVAPDLLLAEVCNVGWRLLRTGRMARAQFDSIPTALPHYFDELVALAALAPRAAAIAVQLDRPVYDCFYLAVAEVRQLPLVTADRQLLGRLATSRWRDAAIHVADYRPGG